MPEFHVLNLGAGVQSTCLYLMEREGGFGLHFDYAVFADTKSEPKSVYSHLNWLKSVGGAEIIIASAGNLKDDLIAGRNATGQNVDVTIPVFLGGQGKKTGLSSRQCTKQYKISVVERTIRRTILGMKPKQRIPKTISVHQYFGISVDESRRASRITERFKSIKWSQAHFPFLDMGWGRRGCIEWLKNRVPHSVPKSACVFCPFRDDHGWAEMKRDEPESFAAAVEVDRALRRPGLKMPGGEERWLHRTCLPLDVIDFDNLPPQQLDGFTLYDCSGACGN